MERDEQVWGFLFSFLFFWVFFGGKNRETLIHTLWEVKRKRDTLFDAGQLYHLLEYGEENEKKRWKEKPPLDYETPY